MLFFREFQNKLPISRAALVTGEALGAGPWFPCFITWVVRPGETVQRPALREASLMSPKAPPHAVLSACQHSKRSGRPVVLVLAVRGRVPSGPRRCVVASEVWPQPECQSPCLPSRHSGHVSAGAGGAWALAATRRTHFQRDCWQP